MIAMERLKELFDFNEERYLFVHKYAGETGRSYSGRSRFIGNPAGKVNKSHGYREIRIDGKTYKEHRLIWFWYYGEMPLNEVDHINRIRTDNRIENLREATGPEQRQNVSLRRDSSSGYPGVNWRKETNKWRVRIQINENVFK